jgi:hypothetical protein
MAARYSNNPRTRNFGGVYEFEFLDIRYLRKEKLLVDYQLTHSSLTSIDKRSGQARLWFILEADLRHPDSASLKVTTAAWGRDSKQEVIRLVGRPARFGGRRWFFKCPVNGSLCETLHLVLGSLRSRAAARLTYPSQSEGAADRLIRIRDKLEKRVKGADGKGRPRGDNRLSLWAKRDRIESALDGVGAKIADRIDLVRFNRRVRKEILRRETAKAERLMNEARQDRSVESIVSEYTPYLEKLKGASVHPGVAPLANADSWSLATDDLPRVELAILRRLKYMRDGYLSGGQLGWSSATIATPGRQIFFLFDLREGERPCAIFAFNDLGNVTAELFWLKQIKGDFGRPEFHFLCPQTGKPVKRLFYRGGVFISSHTFARESSFPLDFSPADWPSFR